MIAEISKQSPHVVITVGKGCALLPVRYRRTRVYAKINLADIDRCNRYRWYATNSGRCIFAIWQRNNQQRAISLAQFVHYRIEFLSECPAKMVTVQHHNGDSFDYRQSNLGFCDRGELSRRNSTIGMKRKKKSGLPTGVSFHSGRKKAFTATLWLNGFRHHLGYHFTAERASRTYQNALRKWKMELKRREGARHQ